MPLPLSVPIPCVQGNTDPAPASTFWLFQRRMAAEIMRHNSGQRNLFTLTYCQDLPFPFLLGCPRPCSPHTAPYSSAGEGAAAGAPHGQGRSPRRAQLPSHTDQNPAQNIHQSSRPIRAVWGWDSPFRNLRAHPYFPPGCVKHITITFPLPVSYSPPWFPLLQFLHTTVVGPLREESCPRKTHTFSHPRAVLQCWRLKCSSCSQH